MKRGITLIEVIIVVGVLLTLVGMASVSFLPLRSRSFLDTAVTTLVSDLRSQQIKALAGDTEGRSVNDNYGIYFGTNSYTLFHGTSFNPDDPSNFMITLEDNISVNSTLPSSRVIFSIKSGEVLSFSETQNSITLEDTVADNSKTININRYGVVTSVN